MTKPQGFESVLVKIQGQGTDQLSWTYLIFNEAQITPAYKLSFVYEPLKSKLNKNLFNVTCDACSLLDITSYCLNHKSFYCELHEKEAHKTELNHFRVSVSQ